LPTADAMREARPTRQFVLLLLPCFCVLLAVVFGARAQGYVTIEIAEPFRGNSLSGTVLDASRAPLERALVERCEKDWKNCFAQVQTDDRGRFSWPDAKKGKHFLQISSPGYNPTRITVIVDKNAKADVQLELHIAN
jgi:hypothetical protein